MLSKGMQQKLALACALVKETRVLMLDEPTLGLDPSASYDFRLLVRELSKEDGRTIIFSSHDMAAVEAVCDRVVIVNNGHVVADDSVANLVRLFNVRGYTFTITGQLHQDQRNALVALFPLLEIRTEDPSRTVIDIEFPDASSLYEALDVLRQGECVVESIDRRDPNLEQIFLRILDESSRT
jgi:ABC-2 type transport system ATP-binding protein